MSSVGFDGGKCKSKQQVKAYFYHDKRCAKQHSNEHIDKSKSHLNWSVYGLTYQQACEKFDARIAELDATTNKNKRKDRVEMFALEVPAPPALPENQLKAWFNRVTDILTYKYGEQNLIDADFHMDEIHDYVDAETHEKRTSVAHGHYNFVPECNGQLNGKWFSARKHMYELNNAIQAMTQAEFGCNFMDGTKRKSNRTVDELKNASIKAENELLNAENNALNARKDDLNADIDKLHAEKENAVQAKQDAVQQTALYVDTVNKHIKPQRDKFLRKTDKYVMSQDDYDNIVSLSADIKRKSDNTLTADDERKQAEQERKKAERMRQQQEDIIQRRVNEIVAERVKKEMKTYDAKHKSEIQRKNVEITSYISYLKKIGKYDSYVQQEQERQQRERKQKAEQMQRRVDNNITTDKQFGE